MISNKLGLLYIQGASCMFNRFLRSRVSSSVLDGDWTDLLLPQTDTGVRRQKDWRARGPFRK